MYNRCECCGRELDENNTKVWEERRNRLDGVEFKGTLRRQYFDVSKDADAVCLKCYKKLMIKKVLIRLLSWGFLIFCCVSLFLPKEHSIIRVILGFLFFICLYLIVYYRSIYYSVVGFILSPLLGPCEMHPFGDEYTIRERREGKDSICVERKTKRVQHYLMKKYRIIAIEAHLVIVSSDIEREMEKNYPKYKHMSAKKIALTIAPNKEILLDKYNVKSPSPFYNRF